MSRRVWIRPLVPVALFTMIFGLAACSNSSSDDGAKESASSSDTSEALPDDAIVLSNSYIGNAWRQTTVDDAKAAAQDAQDAGVAGELKVVNSNNDVGEQISQMQSLILEQPEVIMLLAASPTSLNGVIEKACDAGIKVVSFDAVVTADCAYKLAPDWVDFGEKTMKTVAEKMGGSGDVILVRGVDGTAVDNGMYEGWTNTLEDYPDIDVVSTVYGDWDDATTQDAISGVLTSAPDVDGVMAYVSGYGAVQAFEAAGRDVPIVYGSNQGTFLKWWAKAQEESDYSTESSMEGPAISQAAYWISVNLAQGKEFDKELVYPTFTVTDDDVAEWAEKTPNDGFADEYWSEEKTLKQWPPK